MYIPREYLLARVCVCARVRACVRGSGGQEVNVPTVLRPAPLTRETAVNYNGEIVNNTYVGVT